MSELREQLKDVIEEVDATLTARQVGMLVSAILPIIEQREAVARLEGAMDEHKVFCSACIGGLSCSSIVEFESKLSKLRGGKP